MSEHPPSKVMSLQELRRRQIERDQLKHGKLNLASEMEYRTERLVAAIDELAGRIELVEVTLANLSTTRSTSAPKSS